MKHPCDDHTTEAPQESFDTLSFKHTLWALLACVATASALVVAVELGYSLLP